MARREPRGTAAVVAFAASLLVAPTAQADRATAVRAAAELKLCSDQVTPIGTARFRERLSKEGVKVVDVWLFVRGVEPGKHAVHIYEKGVCDPCSGAGGHFDAGPAGDPDPVANHPFHSGDLVNISVRDNGVGILRTTTSRVALSPGNLSLFDDDGSAILILDTPDTYCPDGAVQGCAGEGRLGCGIIERR